MGSHTVLGDMVRTRSARIGFVLLVMLWAPLTRSAFAQAELSGSWNPRNTEDVSRDSYPVDYLGLPLNAEGRTKALSYNEGAARDGRAPVRRLARRVLRARGRSA